MDDTPTSAAAHVARSGDGRALLPGVTLKVSERQSGESFEALALQGPLAPVPHVHLGREELFYVQQGPAAFILGQDLVDVDAGSFVVVPRGVRHAPSIGAGASAIAFVVPAGLEAFFAELGQAIAAGATEEEIRERLQGRYDSVPAP